MPFEFFTSAVQRFSVEQSEIEIGITSWFPSLSGEKIDHGVFATTFGATVSRANFALFTDATEPFAETTLSVAE